MPGPLPDNSECCEGNPPVVKIGIPHNGERTFARLKRQTTPRDWISHPITVTVSLSVTGGAAIVGLFLLLQ